MDIPKDVLATHHAEHLGRGVCNSQGARKRAKLGLLGRVTDREMDDPYSTPQVSGGRQSDDRAVRLCAFEAIILPSGVGILLVTLTLVSTHISLFVLTGSALHNNVYVYTQLCTVRL